MNKHTFFMSRALELAELARGNTSPNPLVGAVIVNNDEIVGEGYHKKAGTPHAEVHAIEQAGQKARNATLYVTLEPCCHFGRTPPCTNAIINAGIKKVYIAMVDPNPKVAGKGIRILKDAGIDVHVGLLEEKARRLNEVFIKYIVTGQPFVTLKAAMSLDGKIATSTGDSKWITSEEARAYYAHKLRAENDCIMVGIGTVLSDNPLLTVRYPGVDKKIIRLIVDSNLRIPLDSRIVQTANEFSTIIASVQVKDLNKKRLLISRNVEIWELQDNKGKVDLKQLMYELGKRGIAGVLLEGGPTLNAAALHEKIIDKFIFIYAPKIIGGIEAPGAFGDPGAGTLKDAFLLKDICYKKIGNEFVVTGYPATY